MAVDFESPSSQKRSRTRSPAYPYIALPNALEKAAVLWQVEGRHAAAVNVAMQHWGYKEDSSTGYSCVAALKKFGLVDHEGMGDTRQVRLSDLALTILLDQDPDSNERRDALRAAALGPRIHAELWERYGTELPSDQSLKRYLVLERSFNEAAVDELLDEYKQTMTFAGLNVATGAAAVSVRAGGSPGPNGLPGSDTPAAVTLAPPSLGRSSSALATNSAPPGSVAPATLRPRPETSAPEDGPLPAERRVGPPSGALREAPRPPNLPPVSRPLPASSRPAGELSRPANGPADQQPGLFTDGDDDPLAREPAAPDLRPSRPEIAPWSVARRELPVPLDNDLVARVPYPMTEEDFDLLIDTLQLWKKRLVQPGA